MDCLKSEGGGSAFQRILDRVHSGSLDMQAALSLVRLYQESAPTEDVSQAQPEGRRLCRLLGDPAFRVVASDCTTDGFHRGPCAISEAAC